jgi:hypothetical protein
VGYRALLHRSIKGMAQGHFAKPIMDGAGSILLFQDSKYAANLQS